LVKLGLLTFAENQRTRGDVRLFPELTDPRKVFHSFRHGWKDAARAVMPEEQHDAITGHSSGKKSVGRSYGLGMPLKVLAESMAKVRFPGAFSG
jgi:hypothetical protein